MNGSQHPHLCGCAERAIPRCMGVPVHMYVSTLSAPTCVLSLHPREREREGDRERERERERCMCVCVHTYTTRLLQEGSVAMYTVPRSNPYYVLNKASTDVTINVRDTLSF